MPSMACRDGPAFLAIAVLVMRRALPGAARVIRAAGARVQGFVQETWRVKASEGRSGPRGVRPIRPGGAAPGPSVLTAARPGPGHEPAGRFRALAEAYHMLSDPDRRAAYDSRLGWLSRPWRS